MTPDTPAMDEKGDTPFSKIFDLPLRLGRGTDNEAPIFDRNGELVGECVDDDCEERALAFIRAVNSPITVLELQAAIRVLKLSLKHEREWRAQFDCCMCGSRMDDHDIGSGHGPVSMYDYTQDQMEKRAKSAEAELAALRSSLKASQEAEVVKALHPKVPGQAAAGDPLDWAVYRWHAEVANRPLVNVHRRSLDDTWRQVIRHFGGDPVALCGPSHDDLLSAQPSPDAEGAQ